MSKLLFIKAGKALKTIQRDGLFKGGRRVLHAFLALFGRVGSGEILFISGGVGDSARYRCQHVAEELELNGFKCSFTVQDNPLLPSYADKFQIFIFHRVLFTPAVEKLIAKIKQQKKEIIFETDDLVYDPKFLVHMDYFQQMNSLEKKLYENGVGGEILRDPYVKVATTTTNFLAEKLREEGKQVFVVPNRLSLQDVATADAVFKHEAESGQDAWIRIGYFSGTLSHNKDFATIAPVLAHILLKYDKTKLVLAGPLDLPEGMFDLLEDRIERITFAPREQHFANVGKISINLAPLEIGNPFCEAKSELKFFEAGILNIPTVASATGPFKDAIMDGETGFLAANEIDWMHKLEELVENAALRRDVGARAWEKVMREYTTQNAKNEEYYQYLRSKIS